MFCEFKDVLKDFSEDRHDVIILSGLFYLNYDVNIVIIHLVIVLVYDEEDLLL